MVTNVRDKQRIRLESTTAWAKKIRDTLGPILREHGERVHFRPTSTGFAMIGLLPDRPQRGKGGLQDLQHVCQNFDVFFAAQCCDIQQGRVTGEKALQSWLIRDAQTHNGRLHAINVAAGATNEPIELVFVTDEIAVPMETGEIVCDLLALRVDGGRSTPVLLELKDRRKFKELVGQLERYTTVIDEHPEAFGRLYSVMIGRDVVFDGAAEKWIVWPSAGGDSDPQEPAFAKRCIRVVAYELRTGEYVFRVGRGLLRPNAEVA
jgi:hypothetical protein